ncbi:MAG: fumarate hydratase C-terminal domain-containing protein [Candidatus Eisenbacteria sp.]|nr:fumarate hydratase C-terminal domain-containing protein [Candidatus Eisenbacteria bacterium]
MIEIRLPASEEDIRKLKVGDEVAVTGVMITGRDTAHKYMVEESADEVREVLKGGMIYHCGPVVRKDNGTYSFVAAGPTTSIREEPYEADIIEKFGVRGIIGKGGMAGRTLEACGKFGCVYLHAIGGLAVILARSVKKVQGVHKLEEFGTPEAMWVIEVDAFPAVVTMDSHGNSLHDEILAKSEAEYKKLIGKI